MKGVTLPTETVFVMEASPIKFGLGATDEIAYDARRLGLKRVLIVTDPHIGALGLPERVRALLDEEGVKADLYDGVEIEPTDRSMEEATEYARQRELDGLIGVGGGSALDTCKAINLLTTHPAPLLDYVNQPVGRGRPVPGPLKPLIAVPTTAGTGSETTGVAIFDMVERRMKTGIAHRSLKPALGLVDPDNTRTQPAAVAASAGLDVLSHALESYTALPYNQRPKPARPIERPAYQGSNPISDIWSLRALEIVNEFLPRAVADTSDDEARGQMLLAAAMAGIGFGNAGVHLPHGMSYPVAGLARGFQPAGYLVDHPMIPHGISVILNTPAVVRFTAQA